MALSWGEDHEYKKAAQLSGLLVLHWNVVVRTRSPVAS